MHIYILPQCSTTAASVLNSAGMDAQFERSCCAISRGILTPARKIERGIRHNEIRFELRVAVVEERVGIELAEVSLNTANGKVHLRHLPCGRVGVLTKDGNLVDIATVVFDEFCRLDEHAAGAAARV